jgi:hypothetical protein
MTDTETTDAAAAQAAIDAEVEADDFVKFATWVPERIPMKWVPTPWADAVAKVRSARRPDAESGDAKDATDAVTALFPAAAPGDVTALLTPAEGDVALPTVEVDTGDPGDVEPEAKAEHHKDEPKATKGH